MTSIKQDWRYTMEIIEKDTSSGDNEWRYAVWDNKFYYPTF